MSAVLIVHNEAERLPDCLASLSGLADEIVVLDDGSTDETVTLAMSRGARVEHRAFDDFGHQKQAALELATGEWVLSIDADERVTPALARELRAALTAGRGSDGYWIRREMLYLGTRLRFGGAGSDWVLRFVRRAKARFALLPIHEHLLVDGPTSRLRGTFEHVKYRTLSEHLATVDRYTDAVAAGKLARGDRFRIWHVLRIPYELLARLIFRLGILDGRAGAVYAGMSAFYGFLKYAKMWRKESE